MKRIKRIKKLLSINDKKKEILDAYIAFTSRIEKKYDVVVDYDLNDVNEKRSYGYTVNRIIKK